MQVKLAYGRDGLEVEVPDSTVVITPEASAGVADPVAAVRAAIHAPLAGPSLDKLAARGRHVAIAVCNGTRPQPRKLVIPVLLEELSALVDLEDVVILVATGTHRGNTPDELEEMLGSEVLNAVGWKPRRRRRRYFQGTRRLRRRGARVPQQTVARSGPAHHDRVHRAAFLRRVLRWPNLRPRARRARHDPRAPRQPSDRGPEGHLGGDGDEPDPRRHPGDRGRDPGRFRLRRSPQSRPRRSSPSSPASSSPCRTKAVRSPARSPCAPSPGPSTWW